jgi:hypothetical protein
MLDSIASVHGYWLGVPVFASWLVVCVWALGLRLAGAGETPVFWRAVSVAQILLALQVLVGLVLLAVWTVGAGQPPVPGSAFQSTFHVLYGAVFPAVVLVVGHRLARDGRADPHTAFAVVGLVNFGLLLRAWDTASGILMG